jgi:hypothetical protein
VRSNHYTELYGTINGCLSRFVNVKSYKLLFSLFVERSSTLEYTCHSPPTTKKNLKAFIAKAQQECVHIYLCCVHRYVHTYCATYVCTYLLCNIHMYMPTVQHTYVHTCKLCAIVCIMHLLCFNFQTASLNHRANACSCFVFGYFSKKVTRI